MKRSVVAVLFLFSGCGGTEVVRVPGVSDPSLVSPLGTLDAGTPVPPVAEPVPPVVTPDAGTPVPPPPPVPTDSFEWGRRSGAACALAAECQDGDSCTIETCEAGHCKSSKAPASCEPFLADCTYGERNFFATELPGPYQEEQYNAFPYQFTPQAACEKGTLAVNRDVGRLPGEECQTTAQCQDKDACTQNACVPTYVDGQGKLVGVCRLRHKGDGETRDWVFSDEWSRGSCQAGKASDAGKLHGPCVDGKTCTEGSCHSGIDGYKHLCL